MPNVLALLARYEVNITNSPTFNQRKGGDTLAKSSIGVTHLPHANADPKQIDHREINRGVPQLAAFQTGFSVRACDLVRLLHLLEVYWFQLQC